jgi:hypothetical protein
MSSLTKKTKYKISAELPVEVTSLIKEFSMPLTRVDWKLGCALCRVQIHVCKLGYEILCHLLRMHLDAFEERLLHMITIVDVSQFVMEFIDMDDISRWIQNAVDVMRTSEVDNTRLAIIDAAWPNFMTAKYQLNYTIHQFIDLVNKIESSK